MADYIKEGVENIEEVAQRVMQLHHPKLANIKIGYRFISKAKVTKGRTVLGEPKKVPKLCQTFMEEDIILIIPESFWTNFDNHKREAMIDEAFCQIDLEPIEGDFPKQVGKDTYELSNGEEVKGIRQAKEAQDELSDYKINILAYDEKVIASNISRYGCWRKSLDGLKNAFVQTRMFQDNNLKLASGN